MTPQPAADQFAECFRTTNMNNMRMLAEEEENDDGTEVTWEDQQRINTFSKLNTRLRSIEERLEELKQEKDALDDLSTELELTDEDESVLYKIGESFLHLPQPRAMKRLEKDQAVLSAQVLDLSAGAEQCEKEMKELKVTLYARFGRAINLDE
ncbi:Prefoldin subunit 4 [Suillus cothurnatus]|nr:Prefoldin subunit 4 [Suillus cothurnatus]